MRDIPTVIFIKQPQVQLILLVKHYQSIELILQMLDLQFMDFVFDTKCKNYLNANCSHRVNFC